MRKTIIIAGGALLAGAAFGYLGAGFSPADTGEGMEASSQREVLYWVAPMDPNYRRDTPGKSPMGMDLIPVYEGEETESVGEDGLHISAAVTNNIGVRTARVSSSDLYREISTVGYVTVDETKKFHVHVRSPGWIEKLYRKAVGEVVQKGEVIFELYSPDLVAAQAEFIQALTLKNSSLSSAGASRLRALGMTASEIATLRTEGNVKERIEVLAPQSGVIMELNVGEGMHVEPGKTVFALADLSSVWVKAEVFASQAGWLALGQKVTMNFPFAPGEAWAGKVDYIYPIVDPKSRAVQARLVFENKDGRLKPNMYGDATIAAAAVQGALSIPREALIRTGKTDRVILALGNGKFRPAAVIAGMEVGERVVIKEGIEEGELVVTSGQFLIDSEASLRGTFLRMLDGDEETEKAVSSKAEIHHGMGTVNSVNQDGTVTLVHDPIESLGWPEMTMDFNVSAGVDLSLFEAGDRMHFMLEKSASGAFVISSAMKM